MPCRFMGRQVSQLEARLSEAKAQTRWSFPSAEVEKDKAVSRMTLLQDILVRTLAARTSEWPVARDFRPSGEKSVFEKMAIKIVVKKSAKKNFAA